MLHFHLHNRTQMEDKDIFHISLGVAFVLVIIFIACCSSAILLILICNWQTKCRSISNLLVINSCIAFLVFVCIFSIQIPSLFHNNEQLTRDPYSISCRIRAFLLLFSCVAKMCSYLIQAISRFFITILCQHRSLLTYRTNGIMIILSWLFSLIISAGFFLSPISFQYESETHLCLITSKVFHTSFTLMIIAYVIPVTIIIFLYGIILHHTTHANHAQSSTNTSRNNKRNVKVFQNILLLLAIVLLGGIPSVLSALINKNERHPMNKTNNISTL